MDDTNINEMVEILARYQQEFLDLVGQLLDELDDDDQGADRKSLPIADHDLDAVRRLQSGGRLQVGFHPQQHGGIRDVE